MHIYDNSLSIMVNSEVIADGVVSTGPEIYISFLSDDTETASGFKIKYDAGKKGFLFYLYL